MTWLSSILAELAVPGGPALVLARGGADAALMVAFGAPLCRAFILRGGPVHGQRGIEWGGLAAAALLTLLWAMLQAVQIAGDPAEIGTVFGATMFGHVVLARLALLGIAALGLAVRRLSLAIVFAGLALASQALHGHAFAMEEGPSLLLWSEILHVLAAGAWLGALPSLALAVASSPAPEARAAARRFGPLGTVCVVTLVVTATEQGAVLIGGLPGWIGTGHGLVAILKVLLFAVLLLFAARHRFRLVPRLGQAEGEGGLVRSILAETGVGLAVVMAAAWLANLSPAMHTDPVWPFPVQFSTETVAEDPDFLREVLRAGALVGCVVLATVVAFWRRWQLRWAGLVAIALALRYTAPSFALLTVQAWPTEFWQSPTGFGADSIVEGAALYPANCAGCHGAQGHGDGPAAAGLPVPPADLTAAHLWAHSDGELFWWLTAGIAAPDGGVAMPGFGGALSQDQRWALIDYIRANNGGQVFEHDHGWTIPLQAPDIDLTCADAAITDLTGLRGRVVRLVFGPAEPVAGSMTVAVDPAAQPGPHLCTSVSETAEQAYAIVAGHPASKLAGTTILVDAAGWLRALLPPGSADASPQIAAIAAHALDPPQHTSMAGMKM